MRDNPINILIVDDEEELCDLIETLIESRCENIKCSKSFSASDALKKMDENKFDIVITDIKMPGMDGLELITKAKKTIQPYPRVYAISGFSVYEKDELFAAGALDSFRKPEDLEKMITVIIEASQEILKE